MKHRPSKSESLLQLRDVSLDAPGGRPLVRDLSLSLAARERVALVGRNGVGKSTLLTVLSGRVMPDGGTVLCRGSRTFVPQQLDRPLGTETRDTESPGVARRRLLKNAFDQRCDFLLLDEPTHDLDRNGVEWLVDRLANSTKAVIVASHNRRVLRCFRDFFVISESGCRHFSGDFDSLLSNLAEERESLEEHYVRNLNHMTAFEKRRASDRRRRQRKKHLGRVREVGRSQSRIKLNAKRSYAQEKQGKRAVRREARTAEMREWAKSTRRAVAVTLPLEAALQSFPNPSPSPIVELESVARFAFGRALFSELSIRIRHDRLAIVGPNGSGKSTLVEILVGIGEAHQGRVIRDLSRIGYIAQNSSNWCVEESVLDHLDTRGPGGTDAAAGILRAHRFPLALAARPLASLSPGERVRGALICLSQRIPMPELLVLDEPTDHLDILAVASLEEVLKAWTGGLVVVSHDEEFLGAIGLSARIELGGG